MACAVLDDGSVSWWGYCPDGVEIPAEVCEARAVSVACGYGHVLALLADGRVAEWGGTTTPVAPMLPSGKRASSISAGCGWSAAVLEDGSLHCWGELRYGQGNTPRLSRTSGRFAVSVSAGFGHALAILNTGEVLAWGLNTDAFKKTEHGQATVPQLPAGKRAVAASAGAFFSTVLLNDGTVMCWGCNDDGQCTPKGAAAGRDIVAISAAMVSCLALSSSGAVTAWGKGGPEEEFALPGSWSWLPDMGLEGFSSIGGGGREFVRARATAIAAGNMFSLVVVQGGYVMGGFCGGQFGYVCGGKRHEKGVYGILCDGEVCEHQSFCVALVVESAQKVATTLFQRFHFKSYLLVNTHLSHRLIIACGDNADGRAQPPDIDDLGARRVPVTQCP